MNLVGVKYVGLKQLKTDNVANTGLTWTKGQIHVVPAAVAQKYAQYKDIWELVHVDDQNILNVGQVIDFALPEVGLDPKIEATEGRAVQDILESMAKEEAAQEEQNKEVLEATLTEQQIVPGMFESMTKADIAVYGKQHFGLELDHTRSTKDAMINTIVTTHRSRSLAV